MSARKYSQATVERALDVHVKARRILAWHRTANDTGTRLHWHVQPYNGAEMHLTTLREAYVFTVALASAAGGAERGRSNDMAALDQIQELLRAAAPDDRLVKDIAAAVRLTGRRTNPLGKGGH